ncbi:hypothetical protein GCM10007301_53350 [Azorhizobium oxalatiphilum]|uniref:Uncharacterized protein n=1 Tax=Azorhizobium oxalatiphilum TaxID=980631 RepID=A0A917CH77_9HYPH|nr:hypothetical protein [Azorhizobium oxalatiphilum]GGF86769.1 hypothetical protein GCM10007301_53350 [Azorhizobium oxalatiphilum]
MSKFFNKSLIAGVALGVGAMAGGQALLNAPALANQPFMEAALGSLQAAKANLIKAEPNKGGHRERAIELVNQAINQTEQGIAFAR